LTTNGETTNWDKDVDVVVAGLGAAGHFRDYGPGRRGGFSI
jgi:hypothetical protein